LSDYELEREEPAICYLCGAYMTPYYFPDRFDEDTNVHYDGYDCECRNPRCQRGRKNLKHPPYPRTPPKVKEGKS
jgi:hypothetical protein